jgi:hypothetical protein
VSDPFRGVSGHPNQQQILDRSAYIKILRYDNQPWTGSRLTKPREVTRHRLSIMGNQNSTGFRGNAEGVGVGFADRTTVMSAQEINRRFSAAKANYDLVVQIGVRQESRPHVPEI